MRITNIKIVVSLLLIFSCLAGCKTDNPDVLITESGLKCELHKFNDEVKCENGDVIKFHLIVQDHKDSILSSTTNGAGAQTMEIEPSIFNGDIMEGIRLMGVGDSVSFYVPVDSIFRGVVTLPKHVKPGTNWRYTVEITEHKTRAEIKEESKRLAIEHAARIRNDLSIKSEQISIDQEIILDHLTKENINAELQPEGYFRTIIKESNGKIAEPGDKVKVHYTGKLLDGTKFDSSYDRGRPYEITLGVGEVIYGWDLAIADLAVGTEATIFLPSNFGYGEQGAAGGRIPPNSVLVFDVEVVEVN